MRDTSVPHYTRIWKIIRDIYMSLATTLSASNNPLCTARPYPTVTSSPTPQILSYRTCNRHFYDYSTFLTWWGKMTGKVKMTPRDSLQLGVYIQFNLNNNNNKNEFEGIQPTIWLFTAESDSLIWFGFHIESLPIAHVSLGGYSSYYILWAIEVNGKTT